MIDAHSPMQDEVHPDNPIRGCFGCGADNHEGLQLKSYVDGDQVKAKWRAKPHHESYPGFLNGGIAAALIDCHSAWTAMAADCMEQGLDLSQNPDTLPAGWTRAMTIEYLKPVDLNTEIELRAHLIKKGAKSRTIACSLYSGDTECVRGEVTIVMTGA
ncbi:MAG: PaaI family thioesterase [Pseudomonadota bacterium]